MQFSFKFLLELNVLKGTFGTLLWICEGNLLNDKFGVDKIIVEKQPYQLLDTNREFFPSLYTCNFHKLVDECS